MEPADRKEDRQPADRMEDRPADRMEDRPADRMEDRPADRKEDRQPADRMEDRQPADRMEDRPADRMEDRQPADRMEDRPADRMEDRPADRMEDRQPADRMEDRQPADRKEDRQPADRKEDRQPADRMEDRPADRMEDRHADRMEDRPADRMEDRQPADRMEDRQTSARRRAEIRRRKLLQNSEERMQRIVGNTDSDVAVRSSEPRFHLDLDRSQSWTPPLPGPSPFHTSPSPIHTSPSPSDTSPAHQPDCSRPLEGAVEQDPSEVRETPGKGLHRYLLHFDDAMKLRGQLTNEKLRGQPTNEKLRGQLTNEKAAPDVGAEPEEFDAFRVFRIVGSVLLGLSVRVFVCKYLSIFAPFLTLELGFMGVSKYFPKAETKAQPSVLTSALLLSGIPSEVIGRSMDTYRRMAHVFADLCVYFFTFVLSHQVLLLYGDEEV